MRRIGIILMIALLAPVFANCQGFWTQKANYPLAGRQYASGFTIGNKGYYAFGCGSGFLNSNNLVEYDPATNSWTQKASFPGGNRISAGVFVINNMAYFVCTTVWITSDVYNSNNDVWMYNPLTDTWTQKANFPGVPRHGVFTYSFNGKGYFGLGIDYDLNFRNDFWQYDPVSDTWTQKASCPGVKRKSGMQFSLDKFGYVGLGYDSTLTALSDIWAYDASLDIWTQKNNFPGAPRCWLSSTSMNSNGYIVTGYLLNSSVCTKEFWKYDWVTDTWTLMPVFAGIARYTGSAFAVNGKLYNGLGYNAGYFNDFWEYTPAGVGIETVDNNTSMRVSPNPASGSFSIMLNTMKNGTTMLMIIDASGKLVTQCKPETVSQLITVDCSKWAKGTYYVVLTNGCEKQVARVVVK